MAFTIDFDEDLIHVPLPLGVCPQLLNAFLFDLSCHQWTKSIPPEPDCFVADVDPSLVQKILYIPQGKWEPDIHHHRKADDLGTRLKITKGAALCHGAEPRTRPPTAQGRFNLTMP